MKFSLSLAAAAAAVLAVGTAAHQQQSSPLPVDKNAQQVPDGALKITDVTEPLFQITVSALPLASAVSAWCSYPLSLRSSVSMDCAKPSSPISREICEFKLLLTLVLTRESMGC